MNYPTEILPNKNYKLIDCDLSAHFLMRLIETTDAAEIFDLITGKILIHQICSPTERIDDFSTSMHGIYNESHIRLNFTSEGKKKFMSYCEPDKEGEIPVFGTHFTNDANRSFWFVMINQLHNKKFDYTRNNDPFIAICSVHHTPARWNYWHFSLRWETDLGPLDNLEGKQRKNVAKRIGHSLRVIISHFASFGNPPHIHLNKSCYQKLST
jgi:hypothetical protein